MARHRQPDEDEPQAAEVVELDQIRREVEVRRVQARQNDLDWGLDNWMWSEDGPYGRNGPGGPDGA